MLSDSVLDELQLLQITTILVILHERFSVFGVWSKFFFIVFK